MILFLPNPENYFQDSYVSQGWDFAIIFVPLTMYFSIFCRDYQYFTLFFSRDTKCQPNTVLKFFLHH